MTTTTGNIFLTLAALIFFFLVSFIYFKTPPRSDVDERYYLLAVLFFNILFLMAMGIALFAIASNGGFDWISPNKFWRLLLVTVCFLGACFSATVVALYRYDSGPGSALFRGLSGFVPVLIPLVLIAAGFILLNSGLREMVPPAVYQWPLIGVSGLSMLCVGAVVVELISTKGPSEKKWNREDRIIQSYLSEIDSCDVVHNMAGILRLTDSEQDAAVRESAVARIKTNPKWQQTLIGILESGNAPEAFKFLGSNDVDDKKLFTQPVNKGITYMAEYFRQKIRDATIPADFYPGQFSRNVEQVLRTVEKFEGMGVDYRPAVRELRAALDEPVEVQKVTFDCAEVLDTWIKKHQ